MMIYEDTAFYSCILNHLLCCLHFIWTQGYRQIQTLLPNVKVTIVEQPGVTYDLGHFSLNEVLSTLRKGTLIPISFEKVSALKINLNSYSIGRVISW